jgi:glucokinase
MRLLAGDIGGTKTLLGLFQWDHATQSYSVDVIERLVSQEFDGLLPMVLRLLADVQGPVDAAVFGVAGPVRQGRFCETTNLPWKIDAGRIQAATGIAHVALINDFHAVALGVDALQPCDIACVQRGVRDPMGPVAVIGAGTGLGKAVRIRDADGAFRVMESEGGLADFAPRNDLEMELHRFLRTRYDHVSWERVLSGHGLYDLYHFVIHHHLAPESPELRELFASAPRSCRPAIVGTQGTEGLDAACTKAVELFVTLYGSEAGNWALHTLPTGGMFLAGGIAAKLVRSLQQPGFIQAFCDKDRRRDLLEQVSVSIVLEPNVGLYGARHAALHAVLHHQG